MNKLPIVINLFGGPGVGKSTIASGLFYYMKTSNYNVELINEYAKELVYEHRHNILRRDQLYLFTKQHRKMFRLVGKTNYIITDSPLLLQPIYLRKTVDTIYDKKLLEELIISTSNKYPNINILLSRNEELEYKFDGRVQDEKGAQDVDQEIKEYLNNNYNEIIVDNNTISNIMKIIG